MLTEAVGASHHEAPLRRSARSPFRSKWKSRGPGSHFSGKNLFAEALRTAAVTDARREAAPGEGPSGGQGYLALIQLSASSAGPAAIDDLREPAAVAAARPAVAAASDMAAASAWPSAGSENPTMTWRVTPSFASSAKRSAAVRQVALDPHLPVQALPAVARSVSERSARAGLLRFPSGRVAPACHRALS
jgi:hypothetical protein